MAAALRGSMRRMVATMRTTSVQNMAPAMDGASRWAGFEPMSRAAPAVGRCGGLSVVRDAAVLPCVSA
eukprot:774051-Rhodomonas_salina.1